MSDRAAAEIFDECIRSGGGRADLSAVDPAVRTTLEIVRDGYAEALRNERADDPAKPADVQFYFDYIESTNVNALAFVAEGISFIGVTMGLIDAAVAHASALSQSTDVGAAVGIGGASGQTLGPSLFHLVLSFVVSHEYAHHYWGHVTRPDQLNRLDEFGEYASAGMESQTNEIMADGYATYLVAQNLLRGGLRPAIVQAIAIGGIDGNRQQQILLSALIVAIGGFFAIHLTGQFDAANLRDQTHPPPGVRMAFVMGHLGLWAKDSAPEVLPWLNGDLYRRLMTPACVGMDAQQWTAESQFRRSDAGQRYEAELVRRTDAAKQNRS